MGPARTRAVLWEVYVAGTVPSAAVLRGQLCSEKVETVTYREAREKVETVTYREARGSCTVCVA